MKVALCATISYVTPVLVFLYFPQTSKPIQDTDFKLPRVHTIVALNKWITKIVNRKMLQLR